MTDINAVLQERGERYGTFMGNAAVAQAMKRAVHTPTYYSMSPDQQEAIDQILSKISRIVTGNAADYLDSWTDICGYSKLVEDRLKKDAKDI